MRPPILSNKAPDNRSARASRARKTMTLAGIWLASALLPLAAQGAPTSTTAGNGSATVTGNSPVTLNVPLARSGDLNDNVFLRYQTQDGTAKAGADYTAANGTFRFPSGTSSANIPVQVLGASSNSADRQFSLKLLSAVGVGPTPNFAAQQTFSVGSSPQSVTTADINGDGKTDQIVVNNASDNVSVRLNTTTPGAPTPAFAAQQTFATGTSPTAVTTADVNGDGKPDLIVVNGGSSNLSVLLNTTAPGATTPSFVTQQTFAAGTSPSSVTTADINGDGKPDLIVANSTDHTVSVLLNNTVTGATTPTFALQKTFATGGYAAAVKAADLNGDGRADLIVANKNSDTVSVLRNTTTPGATTPAFATQQSLAVGTSPTAVTAADVNGDGKPDLIVANSADNALSVLLNTTTTGATTLTFATQQTFATGAQPYAVTATDVNGDGKPDLVVTNKAGGTLSLLLNVTAPGATAPDFAAQQTFATGTQPAAVTAADLNGDGKPDLVVANGQDGTTSVLLNTTAAPTAGAPSFAAQHTFSSASYPNAVATADLNGDGRPDIISTGGYNILVSLNTTLPGATVPSFAAPQTFALSHAVSYSPESLRVADVNGDGKPDLLMTDNYTYLHVLLNTTAPGSKTATFAPAQSLPFIPSASSDERVVVTDINGDGKPDWVVANNMGEGYAQLNTTATGSMTVTAGAWTQLPVFSGGGSISTVDLNGDGKPDLVMTDGGNIVQAFINTTMPGATTPSFAGPTTVVITSSGGVYQGMVADINGDGKPDIIAIDTSYQKVWALLNSTAPGATTPSFTPQVVATGVSAGGFGTATDINGDGKPDIIYSDVAINSVSALLNTTAPGATTPSFAAPKAFSTDNRPVAVTAADVNGDGSPDLLALNKNSNTVSVLLNTQYTASVAPASVTGTIHYAIPVLSLSSGTLAFGNQAVDTGVTRTVTLTNNGAAASLAGIALGGTDAARFSESDNCPSSLANGSTCTISVTYTPNAAGSDSATLTVSSNAPSSPDTVALSGTGIPPAPKPTASRGGPGAFGPGSLLVMGLLLVLRLFRRRPHLVQMGIAALLLSAGFLGSPPAQAEQPGAWYVGAQINTIANDPARHTRTNGFRGWGLLAGRQLGTHWALELAGSYHDTSPRTQTATANWTTYGLDALWYPASVHRLFAPFLLLGAGHMAQFRDDGSEPSNTYAAIGLGAAMHPASLPLTLRADVQDQRTLWGNFRDRVFSVGFVLPFSFNRRRH